MALSLPLFPWLVFTIFEPISLLAGAVAPLVAPKYFITTQLPQTPISSSTSADPTTHLLALQLGNAYFLLLLLGLFILNTTTELRVVKAYLWALWIADIGHVAVTAWFMGDSFWHVQQWTATAVGNVGVTAFLFAVRTGYFLGLFGEGKRRPVEVKKEL